MGEQLMSDVPYTFHQPKESARSFLGPSSSPGSTPERPRLSGLPPFPTFLTDPLNPWTDELTNYHSSVYEEAFQQIPPSIDPSLVRWNSPTKGSDSSSPIYKATSRLQSAISSSSRMSTLINDRELSESDSDTESEDTDAEGEICSEYGMAITRVSTPSPAALKSSTVLKVTTPGMVSIPLPQYPPNTPKTRLTLAAPKVEPGSPLVEVPNCATAKKLKPSTPKSIYAKTIAESRPRRRATTIVRPSPPPELSPSLSPSSPPRYQAKCRRARPAKSITSEPTIDSPSPSPPPPPSQQAKRRRRKMIISASPEPVVDSPSTFTIQSESEPDEELERSNDEEIQPASKRRRAVAGSGRNMEKRGPQNVAAQKKYRDKRLSMYDLSIDAHIDLMILAEKLSKNKDAKRLRDRLMLFQDDLQKADTAKGLQYTKFLTKLEERRSEL